MVMSCCCRPLLSRRFEAVPTGVVYPTGSGILCRKRLPKGYPMSSLGAMAFVVLWTAIGYLSGAMMFSWLIARLFLHVDLTRVGDDNPGAYHLFRIGGFGWGLFGAALDIAKTAAPVLAARSE